LAGCFEMTKSHFRPWTAGGLALCTVVAACSSGGSNGGESAGASGSSTGGVTSSGGTTNGGMSDSGANTGGANTGGANTGGANTGGANTGGANTGGANTGGERSLGRITVGSVPVSQTASLGSSWITVSFGNSLKRRADCTRQNYGYCEIEKCPTAGLPGAQPGPQAGAITIADSTAQPGPVTHTVQPTANGLYESWNMSGAAFGANDVLHVSAVGGEVPAFQADVPFPEPAVLTMPSVPDDASSFANLLIPRDADFDFGWQFGASDTVIVLQNAAGNNPSLACHIPSDMPNYKVPKAALAELPVGEYLDFYAVREKVVSAGSFDVTLRLVNLLIVRSNGTTRRMSLTLK
jgi:hypothetical protein